MKTPATWNTTGIATAGVPGFSRGLLRQLVERCDLTLGSRVLDISSDADQLPPCLEWLGIDVARITPADLSDAFRPGSDRLSGDFNLILVRDPSAWPQNLLAPAAVTLTRNLAGRLRTAGMICCHVTRNSTSPHEVACWEQHLSRVGGTLRRDDVTEWSWRNPWANRVETAFVFLTSDLLADDGRTLQLTVADGRADAHTEHCCEAAAKNASTAPRRRAA